jgi:hypothetical protein
VYNGINVRHEKTPAAGPETKRQGLTKRMVTMRISQVLGSFNHVYDLRRAFPKSEDKKDLTLLRSVFCETRQKTERGPNEVYQN